MTDKEFYVSNDRVAKATKFCRMVTYLHGLLHINSHDRLTLRSFDKTWQDDKLLYCALAYHHVVLRDYVTN